MRISHAGAANITTLTSGLGATPLDLTIPCVDLTGWPDGSIGPFYASLDKNTLTEEKVLCSGRSGNTLQVWTDGVSTGRGVDGTVIREHLANGTIEHVWTALEADAANAHIESTDGAHGYPPVAGIVLTTGDQVVSGEKTLTDAILEDPIINDPIATGGIHTAATKMTLAGVQTPGEFRARNIFLSTADPVPADGSDGDVWMKYSP